MRDRARLWPTAHPVALDAGLAAAVLAIILGNMFMGPHAERYDVSVTDIVLSVVACAALLLRRRSPLGVLVFTGVVTVVYLLTASGDSRGPVAAAVIVALYSASARTDRATTFRIGLASCLVLTAVAMLFGARPWYSAENIALFAWSGMAAAAGEATRSRRAYIVAVEERAERAERTREEEAKRRVAEERMRIARELHDVVAHHIALVNVQAGVAAHVMDTRPDQAKQALAHVREASRSALDELRATVGLLRQSGDPAAPMEPAPGLGVLDQLVEGFRRAGLAVEIAEDGAGVLPATVDLTAYRLIQESLTNVHKHAGRGARAEVRIARAGGALEVTVVDRGGRLDVAVPAPAEPGGGHGLIGMRERAAALGGTCEAGPCPEGGFRVHARLPLAVTA
ncbi:sensor histidine kinase [Streptomyces sp. NPDC058691]|uniref:sensor histidine kinase n=1 Tax=Streptomyces sp. NPDC058691 TaxID=3346601 RepID=UPI00365E3737